MIIKDNCYQVVWRDSRKPMFTASRNMQSYNIDGRPMWLPSSQVTVIECGEDDGDIGIPCVIQIPKWLGREKGLVK